MPRRTISRALAVLLITGCAGAPPPPSSVAPSESPPPSATASPVAASPPGQSPSFEPPGALGGTIAFMRPDDAGLETIWTACPDLSRLRQVPSRAGHNVGWQVWSADGAQIYFNADYDDPDLTDDTEIWDIYAMDRDGANVRRLTRSVGLSGDPGASPDGRLIAFDSTEPEREGVWVMDAIDGANQRLVTAMPEGFTQDFAPRFSPDSKQLVFTRYDADDRSSLWIVDLDGNGLRRLTPERLGPTKAAWSPDGSVIAFDAASDDFPRQSIWTVRPDGTGLRNLNTVRSGDGRVDGFSAPAWSPDGSTIMLVHGIYQGNQLMQLGPATMRSDGSDLRFVTDGKGGENKPDWTAASC